MRVVTHLSLALVAVSQGYAICDCGYSVTDTLSSSYAFFTELFEPDFLHLYSIPESSDVTGNKAIGWQPQAYNVTPTEARGPYGKNAVLSNVVANPLQNRWDWGGNGSLGGDPGLQIWVRGANNLTDVNGVNADAGQMVQIGEIDATRDDMLYGSFRIGVKMPALAGTCAAFFWYRNNTQEIDLEYLSAQAPNTSTNLTAPLNLVLQSPESAALGYNAAPTSDFDLYLLPFLPASGYHEYRFDWQPSTVTFYADGLYLRSFNTSVPDGPGRIILNHWSNGDSGWSQGPPVSDTVMTISYVKAYFNSSNETRNMQWEEACGGGSWMGRTCVIPDQTTSIEPTGPEGNVTGKTFFFQYEEGGEELVNQTVYPGATAVPGAAGRLFLPGYSVWAAVLLFIAVLL